MFFTSFAARDEIRIASCQAAAQWRPRCPTQRGQLRDVEQLSRRAVRTRGVESELAAIAHDNGDQAGEFARGDLLARADIEMRLGRIVLHDENAGVGQSIGKNELALWCAGGPDRDGG